MTLRSCRIGDFLTLSDDWVEPLPEQLYKQITAKQWGKGLKLRGKKFGAEIPAKRQLRARAGQFLISKIGAQNGACGIVPDELDGALVSSDFPCFYINASIVHPSYFRWYSRTNAFIDLCRRSSKGSTRVRIDANELLEIQINLPPLQEQMRDAQRLNRIEDLINRGSAEISAANSEIQAMLSKAFARCIDGSPRRPMAEVAPLVRRPVEAIPTNEYPELGVRSFGRGTFHKPAIAGTNVGSKKLFAINPGDLLFNNVFAWEGAVAVVKPEDEGRVGSHRFITCNPDPDIATVEFLLYYFLTPEGLRRLGEASPGGVDRNRTLGLKRLAVIDVPVPPIDIQRRFDRLQEKVRCVQAIRAASAHDLDTLTPSLMHGIFHLRFEEMSRTMLKFGDYPSE